VPAEQKGQQGEETKAGKETAQETLKKDKMCQH
jgi:hypothetical protein